ncbi:putative tRNA-methyl transferase [Trypanosoma grayi]|uniref:putative tRNA-methyl transferase n=1 Tax=Trypanosoma grayi TaxID=71804 RepID=UPI0004F44C2D|nr:putative tRNA-methyl transferase [Trypanosoma grayi]KEG13337.1 putative tRNA-methyl transferase [Trypanosoma grayi]
MSPAPVRVGVALSGGVDSAVAALFLQRCVPLWRDVEALWSMTRPMSLGVVRDALEERRSCSEIGVRASVARARHDPAAAVHYFPLFMKNWEDVAEGGDQRWCEAAQREYNDATDVARSVGLLQGDEMLPLHNYSACYVEKCFEPMLSAYARGATLNVDVLCNAEVKFDALLRSLLATGNAQYLATGHYARTVAFPHNESDNTTARRVGIARPFSARRDLNDQTVFLSRLSQFQTARAVFPLGHVFEQKTDVRAVAAHFGLTQVSAKKTSTGLCFVGNRYRNAARGGGSGFSTFLEEYISPNDAMLRRLTAEGKQTIFVDAETNSVVETSQLVLMGECCQPLLPAYSLTLGQMIRGKSKDGATARYYVQGKELFAVQRCEEKEQEEHVRYLRTVRLVDRWDHPLLYAMVAELRDVLLTVPPHWFSEKRASDVQLRCHCCARHQDSLRPATMCFAWSNLRDEAADGCIRVSHASVMFDEPVRALTTGQALVAYGSLTRDGAVGDAAEWFVLASGWIA